MQVSVAPAGVAEWELEEGVLAVRVGEGWQGEELTVVITPL